ncbi:SDR family oxidoreductase [Algoriphagus namhaensis]
MNNKEQVIVITGASSGIGEATAHKLAGHGFKVVLTARRMEKLKEIKDTITSNGGEALAIAADVTKVEELHEVVRKTKSKFGKVTGWINNAGLMPLSFVEKLKTDEWNTMVDVNIKGVLNGIEAVLPSLIDNHGGNIINISSSAAHRFFPGGAVYCATKSAVMMLSEGLRQELAPKYGINVTSIEPGATSTELMDTITDEDILEKLSSMKEMTMLEAEDIAEAIYYTLSQPKRVNVNNLYILPSEQQ